MSYKIKEKSIVVYFTTTYLEVTSTYGLKTPTLSSKIGVYGVPLLHYTLRSRTPCTEDLVRK